MNLNSFWIKFINTIDFAFQPIINTFTSELFGVEALIRNYETLGFNSIFEIFDRAYNEGILYQLDIELRKKAIEKFSKIDSNTKLFFNIDNRIIFSPDLTPNNTLHILQKYNLPQERICFEISERNTLKDPYSLTQLLNRYKLEGFNLAIDDFGTGIAGLKLLYYTDTDFLKIDRFFISGLQKDNKKQIFIKNIINLSHLMGIKVISEGIETKEEFFICKELGSDYVQGYFIQKPTLDIKDIKYKYKHIKKLIDNDKREGEFIEDDLIEFIPPLNKNSTLYELIKTFKDKKIEFVPIIDNNNNFLGIIEENDIKELLYSPYGLYIAQNKDKKISKYIKKIFSIEKNWPIEKLLEIYTNTQKNNQRGVIITKGGKYLGIISNYTIINLAYKKNLELAQNQNPLTKLPGNKQIEKFIKKALNNKDIYHIIYLDFDNFKPYNDIYGFRRGDRVIQFFAELLQKYVKNGFIGHIGGDDFFIGYQNKDFQESYHLMTQIQNKFNLEVKKFYNKEDIKKGYIIAKDRFGIERKFNFLTVSIFIVEITKKISKNNFDNIIGTLKKEAKKTDFPISVTILPNSK